MVWCGGTVIYNEPSHRHRLYVCVVLCYSTVLYTLNTETQKGDIKTGARPLSPYLEQHKGKEEEEEEEE